MYHIPRMWSAIQLTRPAYCSKLKMKFLGNSPLWSLHWLRFASSVGSNLRSSCMRSASRRLRKIRIRFSLLQACRSYMQTCFHRMSSSKITPLSLAVFSLKIYLKAFQRTMQPSRMLMSSKPQLRASTSCRWSRRLPLKCPTLGSLNGPLNSCKQHRLWTLSRELRSVRA